MTNVPGLMSHRLAESLWCCPSWPVGKVVLDDVHFVSEFSTAALSSEAVSSLIFWHV